jgi:hypothetical protein
MIVFSPFSGTSSTFVLRFQFSRTGFRSHRAFLSTLDSRTIFDAVFLGTRVQGVHQSSQPPRVETRLLRRQPLPFLPRGLYLNSLICFFEVCAFASHASDRVYRERARAPRTARARFRDKKNGGREYYYERGGSGCERASLTRAQRRKLRRVMRSYHFFARWTASFRDLREI